MPRTEIDSLSNDGAQLVASLLARIDRLIAQIAARDDRIDELLAQVKALNARIAEFEAKCGRPPKTPDNSSLPPSRGQKANTEPPAVKRRRKGRPGVARKLAENPDATRRFFAEHCACGAVLSEAGQELAKESGQRVEVNTALAAAGRECPAGIAGPRRRACGGAWLIACRRLGGQA